MKLKLLFLSIVAIAGTAMADGPPQPKVHIETSYMAIQEEPPVSPWSIATYYDFRTKDNSVVVLRKIGPLVDPLGLKVTLDIEGFAGANTAGDAVVGVAVSGTFPIAKNLDFKAGLGTTWKPGESFQHAGLGLLVGLSYRF